MVHYIVYSHVCASGLYPYMLWQHVSQFGRHVTLQIPLSQDVLGTGVAQASVRVSHVEMEVLVAQWDIQQEEASGDYSCQL